MIYSRAHFDYEPAGASRGDRNPTQTGSSRLHRIGRVIGLRIHFGDSAPKIFDGASYFVVSVEHLAVATHVLGIDAQVPQAPRAALARHGEPQCACHNLGVVTLTCRAEMAFAVAQPRLNWPRLMLERHHRR